MESRDMADTNITNGVNQYLPFEDDIAELDHQIGQFKQRSAETGSDFSSEIRKLQRKQTAALTNLYGSLTPWQTVQVSRHPQRPILGDYLNLMVKDLREIHGDRH
ncbi:MAG: hypothetical protein FVQ79_14075, partial [Planctomycetes bacterium]|nr:hypothetical protein [Planctomycetota bacterium]